MACPHLSVAYTTGNDYFTYPYKGEIYKVQLPERRDFSKPRYPGSSRLSGMFSNHGSWYFLNYRGEMYCRVNSSPAQWYFRILQTPLTYIPLPKSVGTVLEDVYGHFIGPNNTATFDPEYFDLSEASSVERQQTCPHGQSYAALSRGLDSDIRFADDDDDEDSSVMETEVVNSSYSEQEDMQLGTDDNKPLQYGDNSELRLASEIAHLDITPSLGFPFTPALVDESSIRGSAQSTFENGTTDVDMSEPNTTEPNPVSTEGTPELCTGHNQESLTETTPKGESRVAPSLPTDRATNELNAGSSYHFQNLKSNTTENQNLPSIHRKNPYFTDTSGNDAGVNTESKKKMPISCDITPRAETGHQELDLNGSSPRKETTVEREPSKRHPSNPTGVPVQITPVRSSAASSFTNNASETKAHTTGTTVRGNTNFQMPLEQQSKTSHIKTPSTEDVLSLNSDQLDVVKGDQEHCHLPSNRVVSRHSPLKTPNENNQCADTTSKHSSFKEDILSPRTSVNTFAKQDVLSLDFVPPGGAGGGSSVMDRSKLKDDILSLSPDVRQITSENKPVPGAPRFQMGPYQSGRVHSEMTRSPRDPDNSHSRGKSPTVAEKEAKVELKKTSGLKERAADVWSGQYTTKLTILSELQSRLVNLYGIKNILNTKFPIRCKLEQLPVHLLYDLRTVYKGGKKQTVDESYDITKLSPKNAIKTNLLQGNPCFGKSTLCFLLAYYWACSMEPSSSFKLCLYINSLKLNNSGNLTDAIVRFCMEKISRKNFTTTYENVERTLLDYSDEILVILDGYDELSEATKCSVRDLLNSSPVFKESTFFISTRPGGDDAPFAGFYRLIFINGFTLPLLRNLLSETYVSDERIVKEFFRKYSQSFNLLFELSPFFVAFIWKVVRKFAHLKICDVYSLLEEMFKCVTKYEVDRSYLPGPDLYYYHWENLFVHVGEVMYKALVRGTCTFEEEPLRHQFGDELKQLVTWNIFYVERNSSLFTVSSKLFMVYFATKYLRHKWADSQTDEERLSFMKTYLCCNGCTGDYIIGIGEQPHVYYVGLLPEIVLKLGYKKPLQQATIEMYHDVEEIENSSVFDTVNLLLRVQERFLPRFHFRRCANDDQEVCAIFEEALQTIMTTNCSLYTYFYHNVFEEKNFLKVVVTDSKNFLYAVFRANMKKSLDRVCIDFPYSMLDDVFPFLHGTLSSLLKGFDLNEGSRYSSSYGDFLFQLVWSILQCHLVFPVVVSSIAEGPDNGRYSLTLKIFNKEQLQENHVHVLFQEIEGVFSRCEEFSSSKRDFFSKRKVLQEMSNNQGGATISVNLM